MSISISISKIQTTTVVTHEGDEKLNGLLILDIIGVSQDALKLHS